MSDGRDPTTENKAPDENITGKQAYNIVSDTVTGVNVRFKDNVIQASVIAICFFLGAVIGAIAFEDRIEGAVVGAFLGLLVGLFGSGFFLMIYRALLVSELLIIETVQQKAGKNRAPDGRPDALTT